MATPPPTSIPQPWVDPDTLPCAAGVDPDVLAAAVQQATEALYAWSGRRWPGSVSQLVRPCAGCPVWPYQQLPGTNTIVNPTTGGTLGWPWWNGSAWYASWAPQLCDCGAASTVLLPDDDVTSVDVVMIGQDTVDAALYRLDGAWLVRTDGARWPACQSLAAAPGEPGAFTVSYTHGALPGALGQAACAELACELVSAATGGRCRLPAGVVRVVRQGVTIERAAPDQFGQGRTGLPLVDSFLGATNPYRLQQPTTLWSPDVPQPARRIT